jgi:uncharacterized lipoprotein YmbA
MRARLVVASWAALGVAGTGCVSLKRTPEARFFVLRSLAEPAAAPAPALARHGLVGVLPVRLPGHLERPQLVTWAAPGELRIDEFLRWGEPLDAGLTRTLTENLVALLPDSFVARYPWRATAVPRCRVAVELRSFGLQPNGEVLLDGRWALLPTSGEQPLARGAGRFTRGPLASGAAGVDPTAEVEAMSEVVADFSRDIARAVLALPETDLAAPQDGAR